MSDSASISVSRKRGYTMVYNDLLPADGSMSARAWGLYVYLVGRPDGWEARASQLRTVFKEGRDAIYSALGELVAAGLLTKEDYVDNGLRRSRFVVDADAVGPQSRRSAPDPDFQDPGKPDPEKRKVALPDTDSQDPGTPVPGTPEPGSPGPEKPGEGSTEGTSTEPPTTESATPTASQSDASKRGTRLPADWSPDETLKQWFREQPFAHVINPVTETQKFIDYWIAAPGQRGVKLDWPATWRNWMRQAAERAAGNVRSIENRHNVAPDNPDRIARAAIMDGKPDPRASAQ